MSMTPEQQIEVIKSRAEGKVIWYSPLVGPPGWEDMLPTTDFNFATYEYRVILKNNFYISRYVKYNLESQKFEVSIGDVQNIRFLVNGETGEVIEVENNNMIKAYFQPIEEVPDSAFKITPEIEKKLEQYTAPECRVPFKRPKLAAEHGKPYQRQNSVDTGELFEPKHTHYFKDVSKLHHIDVYRVLDLFSVTDACIQHAIKKLLVAGGRGAKDKPKDISEVIDTLKRWQQMQEENLK